MELRQLRYFLKTAELLNFSEAARSLCVTQSTLSQQIKQLENEFGVQLFDRNSHEVRLTESGQELLPFAAKTLSASEACSQHMLDLKNIVAGTLKIGVTYSFSPMLSETLLTFIKQYPSIKLRIFYNPMEELLLMLEKREIDFVLAFKPARHHPHIESHMLFENHLSVIVAKNHPLAARDKISLTELQDYDLVLPSRGLQARNAFEKMIQGKELDFKTNIELNEVNILLKVIREGRLATILSEASIMGESGVAAVRLDVPSEENTMEGCIHVLKDSYIKNSAREFMRMLCDSDSIRLRAYEWID